jgi:spore coat protein SA
MSRTFHLLTECECFTKHSWGQLSYWVGNVVQSESGSTVLAVSSDNTWQIDQERIRIVKGLAAYSMLHYGGGYLLPRQLAAPFLRQIFGSALQDLQAGDTVWVHDRPEFALAIAQLVRDKGARLVLHMHHAQLVASYKKLLRACKADCYVFNSEAVRHEALLQAPGLERTAVISGGLDSRAFHPKPSHDATLQIQPRPEPVNVVFSAHLARPNDLGVFLEAMELLKEWQIPVNGTVIGGTNTDRTQEFQVVDRRMQTPPNVSFQSFSSSTDLGKMLRASELFCVPSTWHETAPLSMLEAMACGLPIVSAEQGSLYTPSPDGPSIFAMPKAAERLAQTIKELVEDSAAREQLASKTYKTYTSKLMWESTRAAYRSLLNSSFTEGISLSVPLSHA